MDIEKLKYEAQNTTAPAITYSECYAQVFLGDCLELYKNLEPKSIDLILTDLPYGTTACKWDTIIPFDKLWEMVNYLLKPNGAFITTASQPFTSALVMSNPKMFKHQWQWIKNKPTGAFSAKYMPMKANEDVLVFGNNKVNYYPIMVKRTEKEFKECYRKNDSKSWGNNIQNHRDNLIIRKPKDEQWYKYPTNILNIAKDDKRNGTQHPTQKPIALFEYLLKTYSNENMTIFDPCMGSGTTGVACKNLNRNFIGIEKDENYFKIAEQRINARTLFS
jgi:site-specific DNA-methyltransferase (adenine-specific)